MKHRFFASAAALSILAAGIPALPAAANDPPQYGDTDLDGRITVGDAVLIARAAANDASLNDVEWGKDLADVNGDKHIDGQDLTAVLKYLARLVPSLGPENSHEVKPETVCLTDSVDTEEVTGKKMTDAFRKSQYDFAAGLLKGAEKKRQADKKTEQNLLISPLSISLALGMTANGADGETLAEAEALLGGVPIEEFNAYYKYVTDHLQNNENAKLSSANSIWVNTANPFFEVQDSFLKTAKNWYSAQVFKSAFSNTTIGDMNGWIKEHTDEMIPEAITELPDDIAMVLINALAFDAKWDCTYEGRDVYPGRFTGADGNPYEAQMMHSDEYWYTSTDKAEGFIKNYRDGAWGQEGYSFVAVLPKDDTVNALDEYLASFDGDELAALFGNAEQDMVVAGLPKFSYDYDIDLVEPLKEMGLKKAFDEDAADLSAMNALANEPDVHTWIGDVFHKTHIEVDTEGTRAAAVTVVLIEAAGACMPGHYIYLNRPFLYMIVDNSSQLPVFIGTVNVTGEASEPMPG